MTVSEKQPIKAMVSRTQQDCFMSLCLSIYKQDKIQEDVILQSNMNEDAEFSTVLELG